MSAEKKTIGVIAAMKSEIEALKANLKNTKTETFSGVEYLSGEMYNVNIVAAQCGIGKVFAAVCAQTMILKYKPDMIVNIGVAGSLTRELDIADVAIADSLVQHDMDTSPLGDPVGLISGINIVNIPCDADLVAAFEAAAKENGVNFKSGVIASGDCFVSGKDKKKTIVDNFGAIACEMEGASIGHVCYINNMPCCVLRAISDNGDENSGNDYMVSLGKASKVEQLLMDTFLKNIK